MQTRMFNEVKLSELSKEDQLKMIKYLIDKFGTSEWSYNTLFVEDIEVAKIIVFSETIEGHEYWVDKLRAIANKFKPFEYKGYTISENQGYFNNYYPYQLHNGDYDSPVLHAISIYEAKKIINNITE